MPEVAFRNLYRLPRVLCSALIEELQPYDHQIQRSTKIPFTLRFLACLYFYANGSYQKCVGSSHVATMSQQSFSRTLNHISEMIVKVKKQEVYFPKTNEEMANVKKGFFEAFGIKGAIGAIDCTHIGIVAPSKHDTVNPLSLYMNRKRYYSIDVEAICEHRLVFTSVNAKFPGSCHDSGIWTTSGIRAQLIFKHNSNTDPWLLGDQGYPLEPWLLTKVSEPNNSQERKYKSLHAKARNSIERAFGVLKTRFHCLSKHRILHYSHKNAAQIIYACSILHNILFKSGMDDTDVNTSETNSDHHEEDTVEMQSYLTEGQRIRSRYILSL